MPNYGYTGGFGYVHRKVQTANGVFYGFSIPDVVTGDVLINGEYTTAGPTGLSTFQLVNPTDDPKVWFIALPTRLAEPKVKFNNFVVVLVETLVAVTINGLVSQYWVYTNPYKSAGFLPVSLLP